MVLWLKQKWRATQKDRVRKIWTKRISAGKKMAARGRSTRRKAALLSQGGGARGKVYKEITD